MDMTDSEREFWRGMRALTMTTEGHEAFVGLDPGESETFLDLTRRNESGEDMNGSQLYLTLREKHEAARQAIVKGEAELDA
ncbi:hypothetical protein M673_22440 (plasmid) [Aureimonas sp. AU20]|nr:hypothetical protein M673_22440 [Aureimonas sp. AU20]